MRRNLHRLTWFCWVLLTLLALSACSVQRLPPSTTLNSRPEASWSGKLNLTIESDPKQSFSAEFDLQGDEKEGAMQFYTSLGTTLAYAQWDREGATLLNANHSDSLHFNSLQALSQKYMGASLPVDMIFAWANGQSPQAPEGVEFASKSNTFKRARPKWIQSDTANTLTQGTVAHFVKANFRLSSKV